MLTFFQNCDNDTKIINSQDDPTLIKSCYNLLTSNINELLY